MKYIHRLFVFTIAALVLSSCASTEERYRNDDYKISILYFPDKTCTISIDGEEIEPDSQAQYGSVEVGSIEYWHCRKPENQGMRVAIRINDRDIKGKLIQGETIQGEAIEDRVYIHLDGEGVLKYKEWNRPLFLDTFQLRFYQYKFEHHNDGPYTATLIGSARRYRSFG